MLFLEEGVVVVASVGDYAVWWIPSNTQMLDVVLVATTRLLRLCLIHLNSPSIQLIPIALFTSS